MSNQEQKKQQVQIISDNEISRGHYSNNMIVSHTQEEFILDWLLNSPNGSFQVARIIISPGHVKRLINALTDNFKRYEQSHGPVKMIDIKDQKFHD